jgi:diguanylate cyclase (GGDEF)-like protein
MSQTPQIIERPIVLVVDDTPDNLALISGVLSETYPVRVANSGEKALKIALSERPPALILLDIMMPVMDGYETCRQLKLNPRTCSIPVIFLTAKTETEDEEKGFALGAVDYITKPISPSILMARIRTHLALKAANDYLRDENRLLEEQVARRTQEAFYDELTKLPNRRLLMERLNVALSISKRNNQYGAIMFLDLDKFKLLNDTQGHDIGDLLLIEVANRLAGCTRDVDAVARLGGDEFVVVLEMLNHCAHEAATQAEVIGEKIRHALNQPYQLKGYMFSPTIKRFGLV